jgi:hypothetical protein
MSSNCASVCTRSHHVSGGGSLTASASALCLDSCRASDTGSAGALVRLPSIGLVVFAAPPTEGSRLATRLLARARGGISWTAGGAEPTLAT